MQPFPTFETACQQFFLRERFHKVDTGAAVYLRCCPFSQLCSCVRSNGSNLCLFCKCCVHRFQRPKSSITKIWYSFTCPPKDSYANNVLLQLFRQKVFNLWHQVKLTWLSNSGHNPKKEINQTVKINGWPFSIALLSVPGVTVFSPHCLWSFFCFRWCNHWNTKRGKKSILPQEKRKAQASCSVEFSQLSRSTKHLQKLISGSHWFQNALRAQWPLRSCRHEMAVCGGEDSW